MTIQEFIKKAIEGGWDKEKYYPIELQYERALLDPIAWQAVYGNSIIGVDGRVNNDGDVESNHIPLFQWHMHAMIDALIEGKSLEEYIATL